MLDKKRIQELQTMPYEEYLKTPEWQEKREIALKRADYRCQICNSPQAPNVHHRTYERRGDEDIADLTVLCEVCHGRFHGHLQEQGHAFQSILEILQDFSEQEEARELSRSVPTGYQDLDIALSGGLHKSNLILLCSRPGDGKSSLALNIARNNAVCGRSVVIFSLEMNEQQILDKLLAMDGNISFSSICREELNDEEYERFLQSAKKIANLPIFVSSKLTTIEAMSGQLQQFVKEHKKPDLVIVDYIGLVETDKYTNKQYAERIVARDLKRLAHKFNVPVLALCQVSSAVSSRQEKVPQYSLLPHDLEQDANVVIFIYREEIFNPDTIRANLVDLIVAKNSNGSIGEATLYFQKKYALLSELAMLPKD